MYFFMYSYTLRRLGGGQCFSLTVRGEEGVPHSVQLHLFVVERGGVVSVPKCVQMYNFKLAAGG